MMFFKSKNYFRQNKLKQLNDSDVWNLWKGLTREPAVKNQHQLWTQPHPNVGVVWVLQRMALEKIVVLHNINE